MFNIFGKSKKSKEEMQHAAIELLDKHDKGEINDEVFLKDFGNVKVFYSTPLGNHKDGGQRLFLLTGPDNTGYHPVFTSQERLAEFYQKVGRVGYMAINGSFVSALETAKEVNRKASVKMGLIIDPGYYDVTVDVVAIDTVLKIIKG